MLKNLIKQLEESKQAIEQTHNPIKKAQEANKVAAVTLELVKAIDSQLESLVSDGDLLEMRVRELELERA